MAVMGGIMRSLVTAAGETSAKFQQYARDHEMRVGAVANLRTRRVKAAASANPLVGVVKWHRNAGKQSGNEQPGKV